MAIGRRREKQSELFIPTPQLVQGPGHPFFKKLNEVLDEAGFDSFAEELCEPHYKRGGRPGIPPGVYFRMLFIGYFEGLGSQRGIAWRCADSLALRSFLGYQLTEPTPVHASMSVIRQRLPESVFAQVFERVLGQLHEAGLVRGKTLGIDATTLEANAAMKSIVRKDTGEDWQEYLRELARAEGIENPTEEDLRRMDRGRKDKKVSNQHWESPTDPEARIAKMKDGRTHLAYKAEHAVDLETEAIVAVQVAHADQGDGATGARTVEAAQANLEAADIPAEVREVVADKGYHNNRFLEWCAEENRRSYIPERRQKKRRWTDKPKAQEQAFRANRRRVRGKRGKQLNRWRSERVERTFAHVCETGGGRRTWLRGLANTNKVHLLRCVAHNLGLLMRKAHGMCKPRSAAAVGSVVLGGAAALLILCGADTLLTAGLIGLLLWIKLSLQETPWQLQPINNRSPLQNRVF